MLGFKKLIEKTSPTIIGAGCKLLGDIKTRSTVQVHGTVNGNINANILVIGREGMVTGKEPVEVHD